MKLEIELIPGKIYYVDYGGTQVLGRFKEESTCHYHFVDYLHYWDGYETFRKVGVNSIVKHGIESIREASPAEKHTYLKFCIEHNTI